MTDDPLSPEGETSVRLIVDRIVGKVAAERRERVDDVDRLALIREAIEFCRNDKVYFKALAAWCELNSVVPANDRSHTMEDALRRIAEWADAYPIKAFPAPDLARVDAVLAAAGLSLGAVSADAMRHVLTQVRKIARDALGEE